MLKFIRGKGQQPSAERQKLQQELFAFRKTVQHGFPHGACALAWDPLLRLVAVGTSSGALKLYGRVGVELYGQHSDAEVKITQLHFIPGTGRLVSLSSDNTLHLWEINESSLVQIKSFTLEGKQKKISSICIQCNTERALLGTEGGNVYTLDLTTFTLTDDIIFLDSVMQNCTEHFKVNPGAVECISEQPSDSNKLILGYTRGLLVLWDKVHAKPTHTFITQQQLESLCWSSDGKQLTTSHNDGSYQTWDVTSIENITDMQPSKEPVTPYGPYPCKAITKILCRTSVDGNENITIFAGGMPRSSFGDKYTVTVQQGEKQVVFDLTSRVIDFFTTGPVADEDWREVRTNTPTQVKPQTVSQQASTLIILADEELVAIDLEDESWRPFQLPYLVSVHASAVTTMQVIDNVADNIYNDILNAGLQQTENIYSTNDWPIDGGIVREDDSKQTDADKRHQLLLTGHEDGTVRFWDVGTVTMKPLYKYTTANLFSGEDMGEEENTAADETEWPQFKRVGTFDPYSDDPRLAVKKVLMCALSGVLVVAGAAGQLIVSNLSNESTTTEVKSVLVNIVSDRDGFVWKGHDKLPLRQGQITLPQGYQVSSVVQCHPPAAVTACNIHTEWGLLAAGTAHGLLIYDSVAKRSVIHKCTLNPNDHTGAGDAAISRRKSFKKSLRESFRRLRKGRSTRRRPAQADSNTPQPPASTIKKSDSIDEAEAKPIERPIEAKPADDTLGSMLRSLYFARTYLLNSQSTIPTLWAGTNNGTVYAFTINVPSNNKRKEENVSCQLAKEIQLKHRAPVIAIYVLDGASVPLPDPLEVEHGVSSLADTTGPQRVLIVSEEQFKVFTLPSLKPYCKYKLTAHEGARVRKTGFAWFQSGSHRECCMVCLTNLGDCLVLSAPDLRRQINAAAVRKEDINGISTLTFSKQGEALYLHSSSELQRITVSATKVTSPHGHISIASWAQALRTPIDEKPMVNGDPKEEESMAVHDLTAASGDITVDSVRDHTNNNNEHNINIQNQAVTESSMVVKTTTRQSPSEAAEPNSDHVLEHTREEGVTTRIETATITVQAGTDPKLILEMFDRARTPLQPPTPTPQ